MDHTGKPGFRQDALPVEFFPEVPLKRVVRNDAVHAMRVGDQETNSQEMAEYFLEQSNNKKEKWWIWAAALIFLSASLFAIYWTSNGRQPMMGNNQSIQAGSEPATYTKGE